MKKQEVRDLIYTGLNKVLSSSGFRLMKGEGAFIRQISNGTQMIYVSLADYNPIFVFSLAIGIRLNAVEDIFNMFSGADEKHQKQTKTTLTPLSYFTEGHRKDYTVSNEIEIDSAISELTVLIGSKIIPFLETYQDVLSIDAAIHTQKLPNFDVNIFANYAMHSIIIACLAGNSRYKELVAEYENAMKNYTEFDKKRYAQLVSYLNDH